MSLSAEELARQAGTTPAQAGRFAEPGILERRVDPVALFRALIRDSSPAD